MPEAGSDDLSFDLFDEMSQKTKDALSLAAHLYCPEGHAPSTHKGVRVISNSATLAPEILAYLDRAPRKETPVSQPITVYALDNAEEEFCGYAIEEVEEKDEYGDAMDPKSVTAVVVAEKHLDLKKIVAGIELSVAGLLADEEERAEVAASVSEDDA